MNAPQILLVGEPSIDVSSSRAQGGGLELHLCECQCHYTGKTCNVPPCCTMSDCGLPIKHGYVDAHQMECPTCRAIKGEAQKFIFD